MWRKKASSQDPKHTSSSVKRGGGGVMARACTAASGTGPLIFIDGVIYNGVSGIKDKAYRNILSTDLQRNASNLNGRSLIIPQDNDLKHTT
ncbi:hypothetical protein AOLI_G00078450 [Acnodon oligacanthus]